MLDEFTMGYKERTGPLKVIECTGDEEARHFPLTVVEDLHLIDGQKLWGFRCPICGMLMREGKKEVPPGLDRYVAVEKGRRRWT